MLTNLTYAEVAEIADKMGIHAGDKRLYTTIEPMQRLLAPETAYKSTLSPAPDVASR